MRKATQEEVDFFKSLTVVIGFKNANGKSKKKPMGPYFGPKESVSNFALNEARIHGGSDHEVLEVEENGFEENGFEEKRGMFFWDWKQMPTDDFLERLDKQLSKVGSEVVNLPFDGDAYAWFVAEKKSSKVA